MRAALLPSPEFCADMTKHLLAALVLLALPATAVAQSRPGSIGDCEKIKNDLAYNQCLASFGPKMGERAPRVHVGEDPESSVTEQATTSRGRRNLRGSRGRQSMSFDVVTDGAKEVKRGNVSRKTSPRTRTYRERSYSR